MNVELNRKKVAVLLAINSTLLLRCSMLQSTLSVDPSQIAKREHYSDYLKRIHTNLQCLVALNDLHTNPTPAPNSAKIFPQILSPPPAIPELQNHYQVLQTLYQDQTRMAKQNFQYPMQGQMRQPQVAQVSQQVPQQNISPQVQSPDVSNALSPQQILNQARAANRFDDGMW